MKTSHTPTLVAVLLLLAAFPLPSSEAHTGYDRDIDAYDRLQGEDYTTADAACDPIDFGHTMVTTHLGEEGVTMPYSACSVTYASVNFPATSRLTWFRVARNNVDPLRMNVSVWVDGARVGFGLFQGFNSGDEPLLLYPFSNTTNVSAGDHVVRVQYDINSGPLWYDLFLDYIQWDIESTCVNTITPTGTVVADGAGSTKGYGWVGHVYTYNLSNYADPEGDPVTFQWVWDDGVAQTGPLTVRFFPTVRNYVVTVTVQDDPISRCPEATPKIASFVYTFRVLTDVWAPVWERPPVGRSCVALQQVNSPLAMDVIAGACIIGGRVTAPGAQSTDLRGLIRFDGAAWWTDGIGASLEIQYLSPQFRTQFHTLDVCFKLVNDKYERLTCSLEYVYFNVGS